MRIAGLVLSASFGLTERVRTKPTRERQQFTPVKGGAMIFYPGVAQMVKAMARGKDRVVLSLFFKKSYYKPPALFIVLVVAHRYIIGLGTYMVGLEGQRKQH